MHLLLHDIRLNLRSLGRSPGFAVVIVVSLALGLTLTTCCLAVVNVYMIRSLPFPSAERLYHVTYAAPGQPQPRGVSMIDWNALRDVFEVIDSSSAPRFYITDSGYTQDATGMLISKGSVEALGIRATLGRTLNDSDFENGSEPVAMIGHALWRERFASNPEIVGHQFRASVAYQSDEKATYRIIGVLPPGFRDAHGYARALVDVVSVQRASSEVNLVRSRKGVNVAAAEARLNATARNALSSVPPDWQGIRLLSVRDRYIAGMRPTLTAVMTASSLFLVIVCANVAVLVLLRAIRRQREVAVRLALGARHAQVARILVTEVSLLCAMAVALAFLLTWLTLRVSGTTIEDRLQAAVPGGTSALAIDPTVAAISLATGLVVAIFLSLIPILSMRNDRLADVLRRAGMGSDGPDIRYVRSALIAVEVAGSIALLTGCGLMIRSAVHLLSVDLGFRTSGIVRARIALPARTYPNAVALESFFDKFNEKLSVLSDGPFALSNLPPFFEPPKQFLEVEGKDTAGQMLGVLAVSPEFFNALDMPIRQGRAFTAADRLNAEPVAVISETLARRLWPSENPVGRRLRTGEQPGTRSPLGAWRTIVGVSRDIRQTYTDEDLNDIYIPFFQAPAQFAPLFIRSSQPQSFWIATLRREMATIDPEVMISESNSLEIEVERQMAGTRFLASILSGFAILAAIVATIGIYGVTAYVAELRSREVAIRIAVGATPRRVIEMFVREASIVFGVGLAAGLLGAVAVIHVLESQLRGVHPFDSANLITACLLMIVAGIAATIWPARRTARQSPMVALKNE